MSIDSQIKEMVGLANQEGLQVIGVKQESHSAKESARRPVFNILLEDIRAGKCNAILAWAPDRLSRNAGDLGALVDLMDSGKLLKIRTYGQSFSNTPNEKFLLMILCSQAKLENDNRGVNIKRGIRASCETGKRPCMPPIGYLTQAIMGQESEVIIDKERAPYIKKMFELCAEGRSGRYLFQWLKDSNVQTRKDKTIPLSMIYRVLRSPFYYGEFEYPVKSGNWYKGNHPPLITKELFDKVQKALEAPQRSKWGSKQFPYKQFLKCHSCNSSIVGEEKSKVRKDGSINQRIYYHCSRQIDYSCKEPYARAQDIEQQLSHYGNELLANTKGVEPGLKQAYESFYAMMRSVNTNYTISQAKRDYVRYTLTKGTDFEKVRLVRNVSLRLALHNRKILPMNGTSEDASDDGAK